MLFNQMILATFKLYNDQNSKIQGNFPESRTLKMAAPWQHQHTHILTAGLCESKFTTRDYCKIHLM